MKKIRYSQSVRFLGMIAAVLLLTSLILQACNYLLVDDTETYTRITMHELYADKEDIDTLFLGSSHCLRAYNPELFTELTGKTSFNLGSTSQNYDTSYYLLREAVKYHDIKTVYLDMHYKFLFIDKKDRDLVQANIITDYMRPSLNKLEFLLKTSESKHYTNRMLPFRREWQRIADLAWIREVWTKKQSDSYKNYDPVVLEQERYAGKGFISSEEELDAEAITWWENFTPVSEDMDSQVTYTISYIEKIVTFCEEQNIQLVFVTAPSFKQYLDAIGPYDQAHQYIKELAEKYEIPYMDFNLCKEEYLNLGEESFQDVDHLNGKGAETLTTLLAQLDSGQERIDEYFNPWYDVKSAK